MKNRSGEKIKLASIDELLGVVNEESAMEIEISKIHPFKNHPFKVLDDEKMQDLVESVKINGVLTPVLLRMDENEEYEMVSGHRRMHAAQLAGLTTIPAIVRELSDDDAIVAMVDANIQREELLPSEKAFAYKMKLDAMKRQGIRTDLTLSQNETKLRSDEVLSKQVGESRAQVQRFVRLTELIPELLDLVDNKKLQFTVPYHVRLLLDEFSNIGQIPKFDKLIATIRSREISASIILQSQSQLKTIYKDAAETITGNCDTVLFLGGKESSTLKEISETLGKETIDLYNTSDTRGSNRSYGLNYQKTGKELMSRDELAVMDGEKCILQLRGVRPFLSNKYDITKHKRYKELADFNKNNAFDVEKYLAHRLVLSEDTEFEMYEVTVTQEDVSAIEAEEGED